MMRVYNRVFRLSALSPSDPAQSTFSTQTVPSGQIWQVVAGSFTFASVGGASAASANIALYSAGATAFWEIYGQHSFTNGASGEVTFGRALNYGYSTAGAQETITIPDRLLMPGDVLDIGGSASLGNYQVSSISVLVNVALLGY